MPWRMVNGEQVQDWDCAEALDLSRMTENLRKLTHEHRIVIVDGFLLYGNAKLSELYTHRFLLHVDYDTMVARRASRVYPIDGDMDNWTDPPNYVRDIVSPTYLQQHASILSEGVTLYGWAVNVVDTSQLSADGVLQVILKLMGANNAL